jgi:hypothetical protein
MILSHSKNNRFRLEANYRLNGDSMINLTSDEKKFVGIFYI